VDNFKTRAAEREAQLVLLIARWIVHDRRLPDIERILAGEPVDWEHFQALLTAHELHPFAYACFKYQADLLPAGKADLLQRSYYYNVARLACFQSAFLEIIDMCGARGVCVLPLKGTAFLVDNLYGGKTGLRPMVDIDILVKNEDLPETERLLGGSGYRKELGGFKEDYWRRQNYHIGFAKPLAGPQLPLMVEVHWLLDYPRRISVLPRLWDRAVKCGFEGRDAALMSPEDMLFCLALHVRRYGTVLSMKSACDFACLLKKYKGLDWDYILKEARNGQMRASVYFRLVQARIFFNIEIPAALAKGLGLPAYKMRAIEKFILKNTFSLPADSDKTFFLKNHFLVYDDFREPVGMIINMPQEQFAKFYGLAPYGRKALVLYRFRFLYFPFFLGVLLVKYILHCFAKIPGVCRISE
jgi:hypothetical protein